MAKRNLIGWQIHSSLGYLRDKVWTQGTYKRRTWLVSRFSRSSTCRCNAKEKALAHVQDWSLDGSARTCFKNANLGFLVQTKVESASSVLCLLIHCRKQERRKEFEEEEGGKKCPTSLFVCLNIWTSTEAILEPLPRTSHSSKIFVIIYISSHYISYVMHIKMYTYIT